MLAGKSAKGFTLGTHRSCSPAETWERIQPHFLKTGLTRVADITGLDRIGIPVTLAYRPDSPTMANSTGKGLTLEASLVSGAMEAMELYHAEHIMLPAVEGSYDEMAERSQVPVLEDLPLTRHSLFTLQTRERWVIGHDLCDGGDIAVPVDLVALWDTAFEREGYLQSFQLGSNGLASGNHVPEAILSGLLEVIERDAVTSHLIAEHQTGQTPPRVRMETVTAPLVRSLLEQLQAADVTPILYECRVDTEVPVYMCRLFDARDRQVGMSLGYGAHLDPEVAMVRALTEAVQSRLVIIAGSRDDIFRRNLQQIHLADTQSWLETETHSPATVDCGNLSSEATETFEGDIAVLLAKLQQAGLRHVILFDLSRPEFSFAVVRIVVPGLEGYKFDYYRPGRRALALVRQRREEVHP